MTRSRRVRTSPMPFAPMFRRKRDDETYERPPERGYDWNHWRKPTITG